MYIQTWTWNSRVRHIPLIGGRLNALITNLCGALTGHPASDTEFGFGGGEVDVWCRWCGKPGVMKFEGAVERWPRLIHYRGMLGTSYLPDDARRPTDAAPL